MKMQIFEDLVSALKEQAVLSVTMDALRAMNGSERLDPHARVAIASNLNRLGIAFTASGPLDRPLPDDPDTEVRLFLKGSPAEKLIRAALLPSEKNDRFLRGLWAPLDALAIPRMQQVARELLDLADAHDRKVNESHRAE